MELFSVVILCSATDSAFNHFHQTTRKNAKFNLNCLREEQVNITFKKCI